MKKQLNGLFGNTVKLIAAMILISACTKTRQAELPEDDQPNVFAISEIPKTSESTPYSAKLSEVQTESEENGMKALDLNTSQRLSSGDVQVPARLAFMFENLPVSNQSSRQFKITFSVEKDYVTAYKVAAAKELTLLEKALAVSSEEVQLLTQKQKSDKTKAANLTAQLKKAESQKLEVKNGKKEGTLLVPLFRYKIEDYGILQRTKNELKESTSVLTLKKTNWIEATHIKITAKIDNRIVLGLQDADKDLLDTLFLETKLDNRVMSAEELQSQLKFGMKFVDGKTQVYTKLDESVMHIYEITTLDKLNEQQKRLIKYQTGNQEVISCSDTKVSSFVKSDDKDCVLLLKADLPINYVQTKVEINENNGTNSLRFKTQNAPRSQSAGLVQILENTAAKQVDISGSLDPDSAVRISDLKGEFFYRRTFENASNIFLGRTGTSGDMTIIRFELEDDRIVVRNQQSLITYTGQGPKDREELMSFPVKYIRMNKISANGTILAIPVAEVTTKEKAEYAVIDWTKNTVPDANSPLAFYSGGDCIYATSSQRVTDTDMRLASDGVLNFSISGSYTVKPQMGCFAIKEVNSAYWGGTYQFNFNLSERISFMRHVVSQSDIQFAQNISAMAQEAFNFGVFTLADKVKQNGTLDNRDGSEKYMPIIHDFRNGRKLKYYVGGLNNSEATPPERRQLIIEATQQVVDEWNKTLRYAFRGTSLERTGDYVEIVIDDGKTNAGHLGDLDRNYIWYQELEAENGLLGVAQPAANPRSGTIQSANVIVYSGNTFDQTERLLAMTAISRKYEKMIEDLKKQAIEDAKKEQEVVETKDKAQEASVANDIKNGNIDSKQVERIQAKAQRLNKTLLQSIQALQVDHQNIKEMIKDIRMNKSVSANQRKLTRELLRSQIKGQTIEYPANESTFLKKITELTVNKKLAQNPHRLELALNEAFIRYGQLDEEVKQTLKTRSEMLGAIIKFDESMKNRPGCYMYSRNDINDEGLTLDKDPRKNLMLNFKKNIMSTLSHELGHAFGLLHNFKASTDKANYEFPGEKTGRNYSSIMDYIADIDMKYAGPGPYDAHAMRAAYTGMVELSDAARKDEKIVKALGASADGLVSINNVVKAMGQKSTVHFTKETLNKRGILKYFEQCSDGGIETSSLCAQFDSGGSATDIVSNFIADYSRAYVSRNYVYDKITFGWPEKIQIIQRNISLFQNIRRYLDEAVMNAIFSPGRTEEENEVVLNDLVNAAKKGYMFFHELIRTPDASGVKLTNFNKRFMAVPYKYEKPVVDAQGQVTGTEEVQDIKVLEARSLYDVAMTRDKIDTIGIGYDKLFAMQFLMQSSAAQATDDSRVSMISYVDFEQFFMGVSDPAESLTLNTILEILSDDLKAGFFAPTQELSDLPLISVSSSPVEINRSLGDQTAVAAIIGLAESKWRGFDPFAETFKISRSSVRNSPKDRFSVAKAGQDRSLSDTRVFFASQNAVAAEALIKTSARNEAFLDNKVELFEAMKEIYMSDLEWRKPISDAVAKACETGDNDEPKDAAACEAAKAKTAEEHIKDMPQLAALKSKADGISKKLAGILRRMNQKELIMSKDLDAADSASNFGRQVEVVRSTLSSQISLITEVMTILENTKPDALQGTIQAISQALNQSRAQNDKLSVLPIIAMTHSFITELSSNLKVELQGGNGTVTGTTIAGLLMEKDKIKEQYDKQLEVIEKLSLYTGLVDPDTILQ